MNKNITKDNAINMIRDLRKDIESDDDEYNVNDLVGMLDDLENYIKSTTTIDEIKEYYDLDPYLYYVILKEGYRKLFELENEKFLTQCKEDGEIFHCKNRGETSRYKNTFTIDEIRGIKQKYGVDLEIYDIIKVLEYEEDQR